MPHKHLVNACKHQVNASQTSRKRLENTL